MIPKPGLFDSHVHLQDYEPDTDITLIIKQATDSGVTHLVCNGTYVEDWVQVKTFADDDPCVIPCFGVHPWFVPQNMDWVSLLEDYVRLMPCGIGEIGLDRLREPVNRSLQEDSFRVQLDIARRYERPAMIHCVKAWGWLMDILRDEQPLPAGMLIHSFAGSTELIKPLAQMGAYFSFSGKALFSNYKSAHKALRAVPLDRLLLESDAPNMLPPDGYRAFTVPFSDGEQYNHPGNLPVILNGISTLLEIEPERLQEIVWENSLRFFGPLLKESTS
ncbi:MAG: TatD family hydrolase [Armatimonadota bacterium]